MRTEDARFSHINVDHNIEIAGIKLIDENSGLLNKDIVSVTAEGVDFDLNNKFSTVDETTNGLLANVEELQRDVYGSDNGPRESLLDKVTDLQELANSSNLYIGSLNDAVYGLFTTEGTPTGLVANVSGLQQDLGDLWGNVDSNFKEFELFKSTTVPEIEQSVQNNTDAIGLIEANVDDLYARIAILTEKLDKLETIPTDPLEVRLFSVSNTQADFTITGGDATANISANINGVATESEYTNQYSLDVSQPGVLHYNVGFIQVGLPEEISVSFNVPSSSVIQILLDTVTNSSVSFKVESPAPVEHRGKDLVVSLKNADTVVANKTLVHYTGAPTLSVFDNLTANTEYQLTVTETNTVLLTEKFITSI